MTTLHEGQPTGPARSPHRHRTRLLVVSVVVVIAVLAVVLALVLRGHHRDLLPGSSTVRGSGAPASQMRTLPPFTAVELAGSTRVTVQVGAPQSVVVHADDNLVSHVRTSVRSGALVIETTGSYSIRAPMRVAVVVPEVTSATLSGSGDMLVDGVNSSSFTVSLPGSGTMQVAGHAEHVKADLPGAGQINVHGLIAREAEVQLSGTGEIRVYATHSLDAEVSGSGSVIYAGNPPQVARTVTGSGTVEPE